MSETTKADGEAALQEEPEQDPDIKQCERCSRWKEIRQRLRISKVLTTAIQTLEARFKERDFKPSVGDYLKLVEMEQELEEVSLAGKEIVASWVDPTTSCSEE